MTNLIKKWFSKKNHNEKIIYTESTETLPVVDYIESVGEIPEEIPKEFEASESEEKFLSLSKEMSMNRNSIYTEIVEFIPVGIRTSVMNLNIIQRNQMFLRYLGCPNRTLHENDKIWSSLKNIDILKMTLPEIEKAIKSLWDYLNPSENDKKKYGEVFTPFELVNEMLDTLPTYVWSNPNLKWLEPANGVGNFAIVIIKRLMIGLRSWEPDEEKRYKHIIENMIYVCELQSKNMFVWLFTIDRQNKYDVKFYRESFLGDGFTDKMKEWGVDKFDVSISNPPYQSFEDERKTNGGNNKKLWPLFFKKMIDISSKEMSILVPTSWAAGAKNPLDSTNIFNDLVKQNSVNEINLDCRKYFDVGIDIGYISMSLFRPETNKCLINKIHINNLNNWVLLPKNSNSIRIFEKFSAHEKFNFVMVRKDFKLSDLKNEKDNIYKYKTYVGRDGFKFCSQKTNFDNNRKVLTHRMGSLKFVIDEIGEITPNYSQVYLLDDKEIGDNLKSLFDTKLYKFLYNNIKYTQYNESRILNQLPKVDLSKKWTDDELFEYFGISDEEKELILR